jgi:uncharacterized damage-inducible protein DinB
VNDGIRFSELLAYNQQETARWKEWFAAHPEALNVPCDIAGGKTIADLLFHIFSVELVYAHIVSNLPRPDFQTLPRSTADELFGISEEAARKIGELLRSVTGEQWDQTLPLGSRDIKASRRKMLSQAFLHGVHHRGQMANILRQQGFKQEWIHDILLSSAPP